MTSLSPPPLYATSEGKPVSQIIPGDPLRRLRLAALAGVAQGLRQAARGDARRRVAVPAHARPYRRRALRGADRGHAAGVAVPRRRTGRGGGRRDRDRARARGARHAGRGDAGRLPRRPARPLATVLVMPSDHLIPDVAAFARAAAAAARLAVGRSDRRLGSRPDRAFDRLRLHRPRRGARPPAAMRSRVSWRSPTPPGRPS